MTGLTSGQTFLSILDECDRPLAAQLFERAIRDGRAESTFEAITLVVGLAWREHRRARRRRGWIAVLRCQRIAEVVVENAVAAEDYAATFISLRAAPERRGP